LYGNLADARRTRVSAISGKKMVDGLSGMMIITPEVACVGRDPVTKALQ
jgi:hypothetical protein